MRRAIAVLGVPVSGKSTLVKPYLGRIIQIGEFAHSLQEDSSLKQKCIEHWRKNTLFSSEVLNEIIGLYPLEEKNWYIFDGTPRDIQSISVIERLFELTTLVEIDVRDDVWLERANNASNNGRKARYDSSIQQLLKRKEVYEQNMGQLRCYFQRRYKVDNSGDLDIAKKQFAQIIEQIFPN